MEAGEQPGREKPEPALISSHLLIASHLVPPFKRSSGHPGYLGTLVKNYWSRERVIRTRSEETPLPDSLSLF